MGTRIDMHNIDFNDLIKTVQACTGDVFLETDEGDSLNLKSRLCQMIGLAGLLSKAEIAEASIRCVNRDDESKLFRFNLYQEVPENND